MWSSALTTGIFGGIYGLFIGSGEASLVLATSAAINGGVAGATFFSVREYVASPALASMLSGSAYTQRLNELSQRRSAGLRPGEKISWWDLRLHKLPDSAISGAVTGAVFNSWKRGRAGIAPGLSTGGFVCTVLQLLYNEVHVARVKYVSRNLQSNEEIVQSLPSTDSGSVPPHPSLEPSKPLSERILTALGFQRLSDDAYLKKLKRTREEHLRRIDELEKEVEAEQHTKEPS